ncbi:MAG TPA: PEP-CTERM sorting domain-containing protein [Caulobacteraceae bacterium]
MTLAQVGPDMVATGSGTIDLTGLTSFGSFPTSPELYAAHGIIGVGPSTTTDLYTGPTGPFSFGAGSAFFPSTTSGDSVFLEDFGLDLDVPQGYVSGTSLSGSATYVGNIFTLGLTPGAYTWTWNSGANSYVLVIPPATVPEPAAWTLALIGLSGLGAALRSHRKSATVPV